MRHFVLAILLFFFSYNGSIAQISKARTIVSKALEKHTSGNILTRYTLKSVNIEPGEMPAEILEANPIKMLIDSAIKTLPDSTRMLAQEKMKKGNEELFHRIQKENGDERTYFFTDLIESKTARFVVRTNESKGILDSTKMILPWDNEFFYTETFKMNPIALLQLMVQDSAVLNYMGEAIINSEEYHIVQVKLRQKWIDVYFNEKNDQLGKIVESKVDRDPLFGNGPDYYKMETYFSKYQIKNGYLMPGISEEIDNRSFYTKRKRLTWLNINDTFPSSTFDKEPSRENQIKFKRIDIGNGLFVLEKSGYENERSLIRFRHDKNIDLFTNLTNNEDYNKMLLEAVHKEFNGAAVANIFQLEGLNGVASLNCFFSGNTRIYAPSGSGFISEKEQRRMNPGEDSAWTAARSKGLLETFNKELTKENVVVLLLNPLLKDNTDQYIVTYYLPEEKIVYFRGNPYNANSDGKDARPREKQLYELIISRQLPLERIVYSGAYMDNAPLVMTFKEFEKRIQNTDFSIYKKWEN